MYIFHLFGYLKNGLGKREERTICVFKLQTSLFFPEWIKEAQKGMYRRRVSYMSCMPNKTVISRPLRSSHGHTFEKKEIYL